MELIREMEELYAEEEAVAYEDEYIFPNSDTKKLTKAEIRRLSKEAGLFTHDKPAYACLATRIPVGEMITAEKLQRTEFAEDYLTALGFRDFRVRSVGDLAKIQVREEDLELAMTHRKEILNELKKHYTGVLLDLEVRK